MSITTTGFGKTLRVPTTFDLNAAPFTTITIKFTSPSGNNDFERSNPFVTAPAMDSPVTELGILQANTYMQYITQEFDFPEEGGWGLCAIYEDNVIPQKFPADTISTLKVLVGC